MKAIELLNLAVKKCLATVNLLARCIVVFSLGFVCQTSNAALLFHPDISQHNIAFSYDGDIWLVNKTGGAASPLTREALNASHAKFSPDGESIAYTAELRGNSDVFTLSISGGQPNRLTYHPEQDRVVEWYPNGQEVLIASTRESYRPRFSQFFKVHSGGGLPEKLPLPYGEKATFNELGNELIFTYKKDFQDGYETWKRYRGGRSPDLWNFNLENQELKRLTDNDGVDTDPVSVGGKVYFLSARGERDQRVNVWQKDLLTQELTQLTSFSEFDTRHLSGGPKDLVFLNGDKLYRFDLERSQVLEVKVSFHSSRPQMNSHVKILDKQIRRATLAHDGRVVAFEAGGELLAFDRGGELVSNLTQSPGIAERNPAYSYDSSKLAYVSDQSGEYQLSVKTLKSGKVKVLSRFSDGYRHSLFWSPNGKVIAFFDSEQTLAVVNVENGHRQKIDQGVWRGHDELAGAELSWSENSRWLLYTKGDDNRNKAIYLYDTTRGEGRQITAAYHDDVEAVFCENDRFICLISRREFNPVFGDIDTTWAYTRSSGLYMLPTDRSTRSPFLQEGISSETFNGKAVKKSKKNSLHAGMFAYESALIRIPVDPGVISNIKAGKNSVVYQRLNPISQEPSVHQFDFLAKKEKLLLAKARLLDVSGDGSTALLRGGDEFVLLDLNKDLSKPMVLPTNKLKANIRPTLVNRQVFWEAWRYCRDFFYDPAMHGLDWKAIGDQYAALLPSVDTPKGLNHLIREMLGELSAGHIWASSTPGRVRWKNTSAGQLGIELTRVKNQYQISKIYESGAWDSAHRSPLRTAGVNVNVGDYLLKVNGETLPLDRSPWAVFEGKTAWLELTVSSNFSGKGTRKVKVEALENDRKLRELDWVEDNRQKVHEASKGLVGYIYVANTVAEAQNDLMRQYRAQVHKKALIIDARFNSGGALGDRLVELLNRPPLNYFSYRNAKDYSLPELSNGGPKILLTNGWSYSGGDGFPFLFQQAKVGPVLGTRTWGGLVGPNLSLPLLSGGAISAPPQRVYRVDGRWASGGDVGVIPDIEVENTPKSMLGGYDPQLEAAIRWAGKSLEKSIEVQALKD